MTLDDLKSLVAVASAGSVRKGAKLVFKTQPAISQAIKRLEIELDIEIYDRRHYRFTLTPNGQAILERAKRLLNEEQSFKSYAAHLHSQVETNFHIAVQSSVDSTLYIDVLAQAQKRFPETIFHIYQEEVKAALTLLVDKKVDLSISPSSISMSQSNDLQTLKLDHSELINVCHQDFIENSGIEFSRHDALKWHQIILNSSANQPQQHFGVLEGNRRWHCNTHTMKLTLIKQGMGWGKLPKKDVEALLKSGELQILNIEGMDNKVSGDIYLIRQAKGIKGAIAQWLWQEFTAKVI